MKPRMRTLAFALVTLSAVFGTACGGNDGGTSPATDGGAIGIGGTSSAGGATGAGGANTGGVRTVGGTSSIVGSSSTGGAGTGGSVAEAGGRNAVGGNQGTGGAQATGGALNTGGVASTGGAKSTGGALATGGIVSTGGAKSTGGAQATGGAVNTGGAGATGGAQATGGAKNTGGTTAQAGSKATGGTTGPSTTYPQPAGKPTVYLAGDSTVSTYTAAQAPQQGWGQRIQEFFTTDVIIVNKAIGGRSSKSFIDEGRLTEILNVIKTGDYLFAQWGINDRYTSDTARYTNPATTFRTYLKQYIDGARGKNAIPVLVTPTPRLDYTGGVFHNDFQAYCDAIKAVGTETNTPVIDLQTKGLALYTTLGYTVVTTTICLNITGVDVLHFQAHGAYEMARLVAQGVQEINIPISKFVLQAMIDAG